MLLDGQRWVSLELEFWRLRGDLVVRLYLEGDLVQEWSVHTPPEGPLTHLRSVHTPPEGPLTHLLLRTTNSRKTSHVIRCDYE